MPYRPYYRPPMPRFGGGSQGTLERFPWIGPPLRGGYRNPGPPMPPVRDDNYLPVDPPPVNGRPPAPPPPTLGGDLQPLWMTSQSPTPQGWNPKWLDPMLGPGKPINMTEEQWQAWLKMMGIDPRRWI